MIGKKINVLLFAFFLSFIFSCQKTTKVDLIDQLNSAPEYNKTLKEWTKSTKHYHYEEVEFFVTTTYRSWPLRMAYMKEYTEKFKLSKDEQKAQYDKELGDCNNFNDFFITVFSTKKDINDLKDKNKWRLFLEESGTDAARLVPESITKIENDSVTSYFYPQVTTWTSNYQVRFSRVLNDAQGTGNPAVNFATLKLLLASIAGEQTFTFGIDKNIQ